MTASMAKVSILGKTVASTWDSGRTANSTEKECTDKQTEMRRKAIGKMEKESSGMNE